MEIEANSGQRDKSLGEAIKILNDKKSFLQIMGIKGSYAKQERTTVTLWLYYILMALAFLCLEFTVLRVLRT